MDEIHVWLTLYVAAISGCSTGDINSTCRIANGIAWAGLGDYRNAKGRLDQGGDECQEQK
jgi:hypothetical protein